MQLFFIIDSALSKFAIDPSGGTLFSLENMSGNSYSELIHYKIIMTRYLYWIDFRRSLKNK